MLKTFLTFAVLIMSTSATFGQKPAPESAKKLVVYTHRNAQLIKPLFAEYKNQTGVSVEFLTGEPGPLIERLKAEGKGSPADVFISVDAGTLWQADQQGLFAPINSKILTEKVPAHYRAPNNTWYGLSLRARTLFYNKNLVKASELKGYTELAESEWKGKLCLRTSKKVYNQSLVAMLISLYGEKKAETTVAGWVKNLALPVFDNDTKLLEAIEKGDCAVGIANTYYFGKLVKDGKSKNVGVAFPEPTHMNISGGGVLRHSKNKAEAQKFLEWLTTDTAQKMFADSNLEYAIVPGIDPDPVVKAWGEPHPSTKFKLSQAGELQRKAMGVIDAAKYE